MSSCAIFTNGNLGSIEYTRSKSRWAPVCWPDACFAKARTQRSKRSGSVRFRRRSGSRLVSSKAMPGCRSPGCANAKTASSKASRSSTSGRVDADEAPASGASTNRPASMATSQPCNITWRLSPGTSTLALVAARLLCAPKSNAGDDFHNRMLTLLSRITLDWKGGRHLATSP